MRRILFFLFFFGTVGARHLRGKEHGYRSSNVTAPRSGATGVDISSLLYESDFKCLKSNGYDFAIVRAYRSDCEWSLVRYTPGFYCSVCL